MTIPLLAWLAPFLITLICIRSQVFSCHFPDFLQSKYGNKAEWMTKETWGGLSTKQDLYVSVNIEGGFIRSQPKLGQAPPFTPKSYNRTCVQNYSDDSYLILHKEDTVSYHLCIQFVKRGPYTFQIRESAIVDGSDKTCKNVSYTLDPWPYLHRDMNLLEGLSVSCPFQGGFNAAYYDGYTDDLLCDSSDYPNRVEIDCTKNEGISLSFRGCIHRTYQAKLLLGLISSEKSECRSHWTEGLYTFILFRRLGMYNKWILRYKTEDITRNNFDIVIFSDIVAETGETPSISQKFLRANLNRRIFNSLCDDLKSNCPQKLKRKDCGSNIEGWCLKSCKMCDESERKTYCNFSRKFRGNWLSVQKETISDVNVSSAYFNLTQYDSLRCVRNRKYNSPTRHYTASLYKNGCQPRFTCLEIQKKGTVLKYKLGNPVTWSLDRVCSSDKFQSDFSNAYNKYRGDKFRHLVLATKVKKSPCQLPGYFTFRYNVSSSMVCLAELGYSRKNPHRTQMVIRHTYCSGNNSSPEAPPDQHYTCTGAYVDAFSRYNFRYIIALKDGKPENAVCWIIHQGRYKEDKELIKVPAGECQTTDEGDFANPSDSWPRFRVLDFEKFNVSLFPSKLNKEHSKRTKVTPTVGYKLINQTQSLPSSHAYICSANVIIYLYVLLCLLFKQ